jgi:hypothetical protein
MDLRPMESRRRIHALIAHQSTRFEIDPPDNQLLTD